MKKPRNFASMENTTASLEEQSSLAAEITIKVAHIASLRCIFINMKLAIASLLVGSAAAFAPAATPMRNSALNMATETTTEKVRFEM